MRRGRLLVGQAGGATTVINATLAGVIEEARAAGFQAIWGMRRGAEGALQHDFLDLTDVSTQSLDTLSRTPGAALGSSRRKLVDDDLDPLLDLCVRSGITAFLYIGGNDSADTSHRLAQHAADRHVDLQVVAVPKTIDNDLPVTDHSPGYGSIARYVAVSTMDSAKDTESMPTMYPVKFIEVMGRDAGWVAAAGTLARDDPLDAPHLVYVPERPVSQDELLTDVERVFREVGRVVAVVSETMRDHTGAAFADPSISAEADAFGHPLLRGAADTMVRLVQRELGLRARFDKPGTLQRMSMALVSPIDLAESREVGRSAVRLAASGVTDTMVTLVRESSAPYRWSTGSAPLHEIANRQWLLPDEFLSRDGRGTTPAFRSYALPLLGPDPFPRYARLDGLPRADVR